MRVFGNLSNPGVGLGLGHMSSFCNNVPNIHGSREVDRIFIRHEVKTAHSIASLVMFNVRDDNTKAQGKSILLA